MNPVFRRDAPTDDELAAFERDGYIAYADILDDAFRDGLVAEILGRDDVLSFLDTPESAGTVHFVRPWDDRGPVSDRLIDAPLVQALLAATVGPDIHFCHSSFNVARRGAGRVPIHQDHHHWFHENPVNIAEREKKYIQILYYPNGFVAGDRSLSVIPGSHRISPTPDVTPERMLAGDLDDQAGRPLRLEHLTLPPGSMVYLNARMFHGVEPKAPDSPQPHRIFAIDIFKEAGPPHRYTQEIPDAWRERATPARQRLYDREPWTPDAWTAPRTTP